MMRRLLALIADRLPARNINHEGKPYLVRYHVGTVLGWRIYLHHFVGPDPEGLHLHPWRWGFSIILAGFYREERRWCAGEKARDVRWFAVVNADTLHRVVVPDGRDCWSLFFHSARVCNWGFLRANVARTRFAYREVGEDKPTAHSDWWRSAPRGRDLQGPVA